MTASRLRIVTTGLAATYPLGGVFWDYLQYALGFMALGHEVLYLEDSGKWCYDPAQATFVEDGTGNAAWFARMVQQLDADLARRWFFRDPRGKTWGWDWPRVAEFCRSAISIWPNSVMRTRRSSASGAKSSSNFPARCATSRSLTASR